MSIRGADRRPRRRRADGGVRNPGRAARARWRARARRSSGSRRLRPRARSSTSRWPMARCPGWRWSPPATSPTASFPRRGDLPLAGSLICYRPYECADGWVTLGALEPKFWQAWCRGVGREDLIGSQFERPGSDAHAQVQAIFRERLRAEWESFAREHDCCLEPILDLNEALDSELCAPVRWSSSSISPARRTVRQLGIPVKLDRTPGDHARLPGPALGEHTEQALSEAGYTDRADRRAVRPAARSRGPRSPTSQRVSGVSGGAGGGGGGGGGGARRGDGVGATTSRDGAPSRRARWRVGYPRQLAAERAERGGVIAAHHQQVLAAPAHGLRCEAQP